MIESMAMKKQEWEISELSLKRTYYKEPSNESTNKRDGRRRFCNERECVSEMRKGEETLLEFEYE